MLRLFKATLGVVLVFSTYDICHQKTLGFALVNVTPTHFDDFETSVDKKEIDKILSQPFYLFANGGQSYVFKSEDDQYVLKLFKFHHLRIPPWIQAIPLFGKFQEMKEKKMQFKRSILEKTFLSYKNAFKYFQKESLVYDMNLSNQPNRYHSTLVIYDAQKIPFKLDPNITPFALQKKVDLFESKIMEKLKENDLQFVANAVSKCMDLLAKRINQGFIDNDCYLHKNIGLVGDEPMLLDIGTLERVENLDHKTKVRQIEYVMKSIFEMIENYPTLKSQVLEYWENLKNTTLS
ncbi:MAG: hypothetical protein EBU93_01635 [Chlamydiae bacterium]|jgi:hypothetical protein|nr:hypothetical protein [Chlamydiota bacterium]